MTFRRTMSLAVALMLGAIIALPLAACSSTEPTESVDVPAELQPLVIGTLPTEDALPLWAAEQLGLFEDAGLTVEIVTFQAATERDAAFAAGEIDAFMGDIIAAANLEAGGIPVTIGTIMLGTTPAEGRFGIVGAPGTGYNEPAALAGVPVGTSSATIQEYVLDGLMRQADVAQADIMIEQIDKVPVRFELLMSGQIEAAALPEPLLSLAVTQGATLLADDTVGENLSQTVLIFSDQYLADPGGIETEVVLLDVWDLAVAEVNADPDAWRDILVEQARLPEPIKDSYRVNTYPEHQVPTEEQVTSVLDWMSDRGYLTTTLTYEQLVLVTP